MLLAATSELRKANRHGVTCQLLTSQECDPGRIITADSTSAKWLRGRAVGSGRQVRHSAIGIRAALTHFATPPTLVWLPPRFVVGRVGPELAESFSAIGSISGGPGCR